jgi:hypothetical protein
MRKEMPVIPVNTVVDKNRIIGKNESAEEEESHKGPLTPQKLITKPRVTYIRNGTQGIANNLEILN